MDMIDNKEADFKCELCGCNDVRYIHVMENEDFPYELQVGCICAGIMEDDILAAQERDRKIESDYT